jgi:hypothetical protein
VSPPTRVRPRPRVGRLTTGDVACWVFKSSVAPDGLVPGWSPGESRALTRCVRPSYRLDLMAPGDPCLLWVSGRADPGVHALGTLVAPPHEAGEGPVVPLRLTLLVSPLPRAELLADAVLRGAEVLRMPAGSNPSWLSADQFARVRDRIDEAGAAAG